MIKNDWEKRFDKVWTKADWFLKTKEHPSTTIKSFISQLLQDQLTEIEGMVETSKLVCLEEHHIGEMLPYCDHIKQNNSARDDILSHLKEMKSNNTQV